MKKEYVRTCGKMSTTVYAGEKRLGHYVSIEVYKDANDDRFLRVEGCRKMADKKLSDAQRSALYDADGINEFDLACKIMGLQHSFSVERG